MLQNTGAGWGRRAGIAFRSRRAPNSARSRALPPGEVPDVHLLLGYVLRALNLQVEIAEDGRMACRMAEKSKAEGKPYDLILMDIQMPKMNGYEATRVTVELPVVPRDEEE